MPAGWEALVKQATGSVVSAYLQGGNPSAEILEAAILSTAERKQWAWALHFFQFPQVQNRRTSEALLNSLRLSKEWQLYLNLFDELYLEGAFQLSDLAFQSALDSCRVLGSWAFAEALLQRFSTWKAYDLVLEILPWHRALEIFRGMARKSSELGLAKKSANDLIMRLRDLCLWEQALQVFQMLPRKNRGTYILMISACEKGSQWQAALQLFYELNETSSRLDFSNASCMRALAKADQWQLAEALLERTLRYGPRPDVNTFNAFLTAFGGTRWPKALHNLQRLSWHALAADDFTLVTSISRLPRWQPALSFLRTSRSQSTECKEAFSALMRTLKVRWKDSVALLSSMCDFDLETTVPCLGGFLLALKEADHWEKMMIFMEKTEESFSHRVGPVARSLQISTNARAARWSEALCFFRGMVERALKLSASESTAAISACDTGPQWPLALKIMEWPLAGASDNVSIFNVATSACQEGACWLLPLSYLDLMKSSSVEPDALTFNSILTCCEKAKALGPRVSFRFHLAYNRNMNNHNQPQ